MREKCLALKLLCLFDKFALFGGKHFCYKLVGTYFGTSSDALFSTYEN
jgi:hypothetical protein